MLRPRSVSMASTDASRRRGGWVPGLAGLAAPMRLSAARPVRVKVSTVVVRSGTARARAVAFCSPRAAASVAMSR